MIHSRTIESSGTAVNPLTAGGLRGILAQSDAKSVMPCMRYGIEFIGTRTHDIIKLKSATFSLPCMVFVGIFAGYTCATQTPSAARR